MIDSSNKSVFLNVILLIVIISTVFLGSLMQQFAKWVGLVPEKSDFFDVYLNSSFSKKVESISDYGEIGYYSKDLRSKLSQDTVSTSPIKIRSGGS